MYHICRKKYHISFILSYSFTVLVVLEYHRMFPLAVRNNNNLMTYEKSRYVFPELEIITIVFLNFLSLFVVEIITFVLKLSPCSSPK